MPRIPGDEPPPHDPDTPPDTTDPAGVCPRCGRTSNFQHVGEPIPLAYLGGVLAYGGAGGGERIPREQVTVFECMGCHQGIAVIEELTIGNKPVKAFGGGGTMRWRGVSWWPAGTGASVNEAVPQRIRDTYAEGLRCLGVNAPRAAAVMFGRTLEAIVRDKGSEKAIKAVEKRLADGLEVMAAEGTLTPDLAAWAKELRLARNAGGHDELADDVSRAEASSLSKLLDQLLMNLYVVPARIRRAKDSQ